MKSFLGCLWPRNHRRPVRPSIPGVSSSIAAHRHSAIAFITGIDCNYHNYHHNVEDISELEHDDMVSRSTFQPPTCNYGIGILIYPSLLLTTHNTLPSVEALQNAEIILRYSSISLNILRRKFLPHLFFITDPELNLTVVACEYVSPEMNPMGLDMATYDARTLEIGSKVYVMGYDAARKSKPLHIDSGHQSAPVSVVSAAASAISTTRQIKSVSISLPPQPTEVVASRRLTVGSGYVVGAYAHPTHSGSHDSRVKPLSTSLIDIRTRDELWCEGSAGFNEQGVFSFIITHINCNNCDSGMSSPPSPASSSSNIFRNSTSPTTFTALTLPSIREWLEPQWRASLNPSSPRQFLSFSITPPASNTMRHSAPVQRGRNSFNEGEQYYTPNPNVNSNPNPTPNGNSNRTSRASGSMVKTADVKSNVSSASSYSSDKSSELPNYQKPTASTTISAAARRKSRPSISGSASPINVGCNHPHHDHGRPCRGSNVTTQTPRQSRLSNNPPSPTRQRVQNQEERDMRPSVQRVQNQEDRDTRPSVQRVQIQEDRDRDPRPSVQRVQIQEDRDRDPRPSVQRVQIQEDRDRDPRPSVQRVQIQEDRDRDPRPSVQRVQIQEDRDRDPRPSVQRVQIQEDRGRDTRPSVQRVQIQEGRDRDPRPSVQRVQIQEDRDRDPRPSVQRVQIQDDRDVRPSISQRVQQNDDRESKASMPRVLMQERRASVPISVQDERERRSVPQLKLTDLDR